MTIETREVLADAYAAKTSTGTYLRHAVAVDNDGRAVRVLCNRVKLDSLADSEAGDPDAEPTCKPCRSAWKRTKR